MQKTIKAVKQSDFIKNLKTLSYSRKQTVLIYRRVFFNINNIDVIALNTAADCIQTFKALLLNQSIYRIRDSLKAYFIRVMLP